MKRKQGTILLMVTSFKLMVSGLGVASMLFLQTIVVSQSAELVMMEQDACPWCERWHEEVGVIYNKTAEGKRAPLRVVNIHGEWPEDLKNIRIERFTPTFVLIEDGKEIDRLRGYTGDEFFWFLIGEMLKELPKTNASNG